MSVKTTTCTLTLIFFAFFIHAQPRSGEPNIVFLLKKNIKNNIKVNRVYVDKNSALQNTALPPAIPYWKNLILHKESIHLKTYDYALPGTGSKGIDSAYLLFDHVATTSLTYMFQNNAVSSYVIIDPPLADTNNYHSSIIYLETIPPVKGIYHIISDIGKVKEIKNGLTVYKILDITPSRWNDVSVKSATETQQDLIENLICPNVTFITEFDYFNASRILQSLPVKDVWSILENKYKSFNARWDSIRKQYGGTLTIKLSEQLKYESENNVEQLYKFPYAKAIQKLLDSSNNNLEIIKNIIPENGILTSAYLNNFFRVEGIDIFSLTREWENYKSWVKSMQEKCINKY